MGGERLACQDCFDEIFDFFKSGKADAIKENGGREIIPKKKLEIKGNKFVALDMRNKVTDVFENLIIKNFRRSHSFGGYPETEILVVSQEDFDRDNNMSYQRQMLDFGHKAAMTRSLGII
jgi:hypothetical protein